MFGSATIRLGIGPHSSFKGCCIIGLMVFEGSIGNSCFGKQ